MTIIYDSITNSITTENNSVNIGLFTSFTPSESGVITGLQLILSNPIGPSLNMFSLNLYENNPDIPNGSGENAVYPSPGKIIDTLLIIPDLAVTNATPMTYDFSNILITNPFVMAGTRYWIGTANDYSFVQWGFTKNNSGIGVKDEYFNNGGVSISTDNGTYQIKIDLVNMSK